MRDGKFVNLRMSEAKFIENENVNEIKKGQNVVN